MYHKPSKTARKCSYKEHRSRSTHLKPTLKEKRENTHQQKRTSKQTKNHQNPSILSKNNTQNHREEAILVSEKNNTLITSFPATCNLFIYFFIFSFLNTEVSWMVRIEPPSSNDQKCFFGRYRSGTIEFSL